MSTLANQINMDMDFESTIILLKDEIFNIKKDQDVLYFQFFNNTENHEYILDFLSTKSIMSIPYNIFENMKVPSFLSFMDDVFWIDFSILFENRKKEFIKNKTINNYNITNSKSFTFDDSIYIEDQYSQKIYNYWFDERSEFKFIITHLSGEDFFNTSCSFQHVDIGHSDVSKMTSDEREIHSKYINSFNFRPDIFDINKKNLESVIDIFLKDINKLNLTSFGLIDYHNRKYHGIDTLYHFIDNNYDKNDVEYLLNYNNVDINKIETRDLYDSLEAYKSLLFQDLYKEIPCLLFIEKIKRIDLEVDDKTLFDFSYHLDFENDSIQLFRNDCQIKEWKGLKNENIVKEISELIRTDVKYIFKANPQFEQNFKNQFNDLFLIFFEGIPVKAEIPVFDSLTLEQITKREMPFTLSNNDDSIEKIIDVACIENFREDVELNIFKEKLKIKSALNNNSQSIETNKKRL